MSISFHSKSSLIETKKYLAKTECKDCEFKMIAKVYFLLLFKDSCTSNMTISAFLYTNNEISKKECKKNPLKIIPKN